MKRVTPPIGIAILFVFLLLAGCELPTPTPTESPISPILPPSALRALLDPITDTARFFWDDPLVVTGTGRVGAVEAVSTTAGWQITYICEPADSRACVNYPYARIVSDSELDGAIVFTLTLMMDLEARIGGQTIDTYTLPTGLMTTDEPGTGQYNGLITWSWQPDIPSGYFGNLEIWSRDRWEDTDGNLPSVFGAYYVSGEMLQYPDDRGFFLVKTVPVPFESHVVYMPLIKRTGN